PIEFKSDLGHTLVAELLEPGMACRIRISARQRRLGTRQRADGRTALQQAGGGSSSMSSADFRFGTAARGAASARSMVMAFSRDPAHCFFFDGVFWRIDQSGAGDPMFVHAPWRTPWNR